MIGVALVGSLVSPAAAAPGNPEDPTEPPGSWSSVNLAADRTEEDFFYRIPALAHLGDGVVLASWDARPGSAADSPNPNSIIQRRSTDNGQTWGPLEIIAAGQEAEPRHGYSDPSYVVDRETGTVFNFFVYSKDQGFHGSAYGNDDEDREIISSAVISSDDGGLTWSEPRLITDVTKTSNGTVVDGEYQPVPGDVRANFATSGEGIQLRYGEHAGRLIQQYAGTILQEDGTTAIRSYSVYSDDHGQTWHKGEDVGTGMDENKVVELSDGRVMLNSRDSSNGRTRLVAISTDGGATYGSVERDHNLPDPTNNAALTRLHPNAPEGSAEARKLLFTNSNNGANGDRVNGAARVSCDDGETWPGLRTLDTGFFAYSSATALDDGLFGVLWEKNYTDDIQFSTFDEAWLNYVCAPLGVPAQDAKPGDTLEVPVTVTNQEAMSLTGTVALHVPDSWSAGEATVTDLPAGESITIEVPLTVGEDGVGTQSIPATFTVTDGRVSQVTATVKLPAPIGATLGVTHTSDPRDVVTDPYEAGDVLTFTARVTSTSEVATDVIPAGANFTDGFAPTACRWLDLPPLNAYNCTTPERTLTEEDIERGWFAPEFSFTVAPTSDPDNVVSVEHTGAAVPLRDGLLGVEIEGSRTDGDRDLGTDPYAVGEQVPYSFQVDSTAPVTSTVTPTAGNFNPFVPPGAGNCRYQDLPAGDSYTCGTPRHTVTQTELDDGFFVPQTTWEVTASRQTPLPLEIEGGEVDLIVRDPQLSGDLTPAWDDVDGDGRASVGDTVTYAAELENSGNVTLTDVTAPALEPTTLAVDDYVVFDAEVVVLDEEDLAAGELSARSFEATAANGSRDVSITLETGPFPLELGSEHPAWDADTVYLAGDRVTHDGAVFEALWWTRGEVPGDSPWGAWQEIATDDDGTALWTPSRVFVAGDIARHEGQDYEAKWWTRNQAPGGPHGPWVPLD